MSTCATCHRPTDLRRPYRLWVRFGGPLNMGQEKCYVKRKNRDADARGYRAMGAEVEVWTHAHKAAR